MAGTSVSIPVDTDVSQSTPSAVPEPPLNAPEPRRSNQVRGPPDRYGEWVSNQHTIVLFCLTQCF